MGNTRRINDLKKKIETRPQRKSTPNVKLPCGEVKALVYNALPIRMVEIDGDVFISAADVARAINMSNGRITRLYLPKNQSTIFNLPTPGGMQPVRMVNLRGIVCILARSKKPESASLMEWLFNKFYIAETTNIPEDAWTSLSIG
jgi:hypothetical protein